ncbi:hypothetical protein KQX54_018426, partial [Cotesia glomerata]
MQSRVHNMQQKTAEWSTEERYEERRQSFKISERENEREKGNGTERNQAASSVVHLPAGDQYQFSELHRFRFHPAAKALLYSALYRI